MKIASSAMTLASEHQASSHHTIKEKMNVWVGDRRPDFEGRRVQRSSIQPPQVSISDAAREAEATGRTKETDDDSNGDPFISMVKSMVEMMTGKKIRIFSASDLANAQQAADAAATSSSAPPQRAGFGIEYDREETYSESEQTSFQASGTIRTADGKEIAFDLSLQMERSYAESSSVSMRFGDAVRKDPLVINFSGNAAQLHNTRFAFDLEGDGQAENIPMLADGSAYLALDKNGNNKVDSGQELFGTTSGNGFADLAKLDEDANGWLDDNDSSFSQLKAWVPDGQGGGNLKSLKSLGVGALSLVSQATPFEIKDSSNQSLGAVRSTGVYVNENGSTGTLQQIDLTV